MAEFRIDYGDVAREIQDKIDDGEEYTFIQVLFAVVKWGEDVAERLSEDAGYYLLERDPKLSNSAFNDALRFSLDEENQDYMAYFARWVDKFGANYDTGKNGDHPVYRLCDYGYRRISKELKELNDQINAIQSAPGWRDRPETEQERELMEKAYQLELELLI